MIEAEKCKFKKNFYILMINEEVLDLCVKWLSKFSSNLYGLRPTESQKTVFTNRFYQLLQFVKTWKKSIIKYQFPVKLYEIRQIIIIQNFLLQKDLQIWIEIFFVKFFNQNIWNTKKTLKCKIVHLNKV